MFCRLAGKVLLKAAFRRDMLLPSQFGVVSPEGVEPIIRAWNRARSGDLPEAYTMGTSFDCTNAFNTLSRKSIAAAIKTQAPAFFQMAKWAYDSPTPLYLRGNENVTVLKSSEGVRQGDPLGPLFFSLGIRHSWRNCKPILGQPARLWHIWMTSLFYLPTTY